MPKKILLTISLILTTLIALAQDIVVVGQVLSAEDSQPLEAASVWFKGTNIGCTTNDSEICVTTLLLLVEVFMTISPL